VSRRLRRGVRLLRLLAAFSALGVLKHIVSLPTLVRWAWRAPAGRVAAREADDIASEVLRAGAFGGWPDRDCLQRSLLLYRELARAGFGPELVVGFERGPAGLLGHAWVRADGRLIADAETAVARFEPALVFGEDGALRPDGRQGSG
jgi:hypothetical protein